MSSRPYRSQAKPVLVRPRGFIYGAKLTFPVSGRFMTVPVHARVVRVVVSEPTSKDHWACGLGGQSRLAIEVTVRNLPVEGGGTRSETFYLDGEDNQILWKITLGEGHPKWGIRQFDIERLEDDDQIARAYRVELVEQVGEKQKYRVVPIK